MTSRPRPSRTLDHDCTGGWGFNKSLPRGGQHVNKASTAIQLRFDAAHSPSLPEAVRERLRGIAGSRMTPQGVVVIGARAQRSQQQNREAALARLVAMLRQAARPPRIRRRTKPTPGSRRRRLENKRERSGKKRCRRELVGELPEARPTGTELTQRAPNRGYPQKSDPAESCNPLPDRG
jgi:ribosome-associated protein